MRGRKRKNLKVLTVCVGRGGEKKEEISQQNFFFSFHLSKSFDYICQVAFLLKRKRWRKREGGGNRSWEAKKSKLRGKGERETRGTKKKKENFQTIGFHFSSKLRQILLVFFLFSQKKKCRKIIFSAHFSFFFGNSSCSS